MRRGALLYRRPDDPTASSACRWGWGANGSTSTLGRNCAVCEGGLVDIFCNDSTKTPAMIDGCAAALDTAVCTDSTVELPDACNDAMECNAGPCTQ